MNKKIYNAFPFLLIFIGVFFFIFLTSPIHTFGAEETSVDEIEQLPEDLQNIAPSDIEPSQIKGGQESKGPVISLTFAVPGIGSNGGTMKPNTTKRNLYIYLYAPGVNSNDFNVKPVYTLKTTADYDDNIYNPTYTAFVNKHIDLGYTVKPGRYQIAFSTEQSLRKVIKEKESQVGGTAYTVDIYQPLKLPIQTVIMGDISPAEGNNVMDIADYNLFVQCYNKPDCRYFKEADLNDDNLVDGVDYNIMARGFRQLVAMGIAPPVLPTPTSTQVSKLSQLRDKAEVKPTVPPKKVEQQSGGSPVGIIIVIVIILLLLAGGGFFVLTKTPFGKSLLKKSPASKNPPGTPDDAAAADPNAPATPPAETPATDTTPAAEAPPAETPGAETPPAETVPTAAEPAAIAESTEIPIESLNAEKAATAETAPPATQAASTEAIAESTEIPIASLPPKGDTPPGATPATVPAEAATAPAATTTANDGSVDKTYYVKKKTTDDKGTWVVLTDDTGPIDGLLTTGTIEDGFERIKGKLTEENGKKYVLISEVLPSE